MVKKLLVARRIHNWAWFCKPEYSIEELVISSYAPSKPVKVIRLNGIGTIGELHDYCLRNGISEVKFFKGSKITIKEVIR